MKRRELTPDEKQDAERLAAAWQRYKEENEGATQVWLAQASGIGGQSAIAQYLRGVIPLNLEALLAICNAIGVAPHEISPRLLAPVSKAIPQSTLNAIRREAEAEARRLRGGVLSPREAALIELFDSLTTSQQDEIFRELEETKRKNDALIEELMSKRKT